MLKLYYLAILILGCRFCSGQNLVPNGDFETYSICPIDHDELYKATSWINPSIHPTTWATPDYYNACGPNCGHVDVPCNELGYQFARSGDGFAGIWVKGYQYSLPNIDYREYIEVQFLSPLVANQCYHFEMFINAAQNVQFLTSAIGVYFSDTLYQDTLYTALPLIPQINNAPGNYPDTLNWTPVTGDYIASGGESYLVIGNFNSWANSSSLVIHAWSLEEFANTNIDDVSLTPCTAIEEQDNIELIKIYPNPVNDKLNIEISNSKPSEIILYDVASRKLLQQEFTKSVLMNTEQLAKGIYIYEVRNKNGVIKKGRVVKE